jgi:hypothetical protein
MMTYVRSHKSFIIILCVCVRACVRARYNSTHIQNNKDTRHTLQIMQDDGGTNIAVRIRINTKCDVFVYRNISTSVGLHFRGKR